MKEGRYTPEQWQRAEALVIQDRVTLEVAATRTGIPLGTVKRRAAAERWTDIRDGLIAYRPNVMKLKQLALEAALASPNAETIGAWRSVETAFPERVYAERTLRREQLIDAFDLFTGWLAKRSLPAEFQTELQAQLGQFFAELER